MRQPESRTGTRCLICKAGSAEAVKKTCTACGACHAGGGRCTAACHRCSCAALLSLASPAPSEPAGAPRAAVLMNASKPFGLVPGGPVCSTCTTHGRPAPPSPSYSSPPGSSAAVPAALLAGVWRRRAVARRRAICPPAVSMPLPVRSERTLGREKGMDCEILGRTDQRGREGETVLLVTAAAAAETGEEERVYPTPIGKWAAAVDCRSKRK